MKDLIEIEQSSSSYGCNVRCSDMVKSFKVTFENNRVDTLEVELKEERRTDYGQEKIDNRNSDGNIE